MRCARSTRQPFLEAFVLVADGSCEVGFKTATGAGSERAIRPPDGVRLGRHRSAEAVNRRSRQNEASLPGTGRAPTAVLPESPPLQRREAAQLEAGPPARLSQRARPAAPGSWPDPNGSSNAGRRRNSAWCPGGSFRNRPRRARARARSCSLRTGVRPPGALQEHERPCRPRPVPCLERRLGLRQGPDEVAAPRQRRNRRGKAVRPHCPRRSRC